LLLLTISIVAIGAMTSAIHMQATPDLYHRTTGWVCAPET